MMQAPLSRVFTSVLMRFSPFVVVLSAMVLGVASPPQSALAASGPADMAGEGGGPSTAAAGSSTHMAVEPGVLGQEGSKTIQMLLELQESHPELQSADRSNKSRSERAAPEGSARAALPLAPAPAPERANPLQNPFTKGFEPPVKAPSPQDGQAPVETSWSGALGGRDAGGPPDTSRRAAPSDAGDDVPVGAALRLWLPTSVMRFVRENRELVVISSLLVLVLVWLGAAKASQKR